MSSSLLKYINNKALGSLIDETIVLSDQSQLSDNITTNSSRVQIGKDEFIFKDSNYQIQNDTMHSVSTDSYNSNNWTTRNGRLYVNGKDQLITGINAYNVAYDAIAGGFTYIQDLDNMANLGVKHIRTSITPVEGQSLMASKWTSYVGSDGNAPISTFIPRLKEFLDYAYFKGISVNPVLLWQSIYLHTAIGVPRIQWADKSSTLRQYMRNFVRTIVTELVRHPAISYWGIANEVDTFVQAKELMRVDGKNTSGIQLTVQSLVTNCTNQAGSIKITSPAHGLVQGNVVNISGIQGVPNANGKKTISVIDNDTFTIDGSVYSGTYTSGGVVKDASEDVYIEWLDEIYDIIRSIDKTRPIASPTAYEGWSSNSTTEGRDFNNYLHNFIRRCGKCELAVVHYYPDFASVDLVATPRTPFIGPEKTMDGGDAFLRKIYEGCKLSNKILCIEECAGNWDSPPDLIASKMYTQAYNAGAQVIFDWGWFSGPGAASNLANLATVRSSIIPIINKFGADHTIPTYNVVDPIKPVYPAQYMKLSGGYAQLPITSNSQPINQSNGFMVSFWFRPTVNYTADSVLISCFKSTPMGWAICTSPNLNMLTMKVVTNGSIKSLPDSTSCVFEKYKWNHYTFYWDGATIIHSWLNGLYNARQIISSNIDQYTPLTGFQNLVVGAKIDGSTYQRFDIADLIIGPTKPSTKELINYINSNNVPSSWIIDRYQFNNSLANAYTNIIGTSSGSISYNKF